MEWAVCWKPELMYGTIIVRGQSNPIIVKVCRLLGNQQVMKAKKRLGTSETIRPLTLLKKTRTS